MGNRTAHAESSVWALTGAVNGVLFGRMTKFQRGHKADSGKPRFDLIPHGVTRLLAEVLTHGAEVYGPSNWQLVDDGRDRYYAAAQRHLNAWWDGETTDRDSGLHHLAHALCCVSFLLAKEIGTGGK